MECRFSVTHVRPSDRIGSPSSETLRKFKHDSSDMAEMSVCLTMVGINRHQARDRLESLTGVGRTHQIPPRFPRILQRLCPLQAPPRTRALASAKEEFRVFGHKSSARITTQSRSRPSRGIFIRDEEVLLNHIL
jgi:hypothetical protein